MRPRRGVPVVMMGSIWWVTFVLEISPGESPIVRKLRGDFVRSALTTTIFIIMCVSEGQLIIARFMKVGRYVEDVMMGFTLM
jgi:hypothetical protein